MDIKNQTCLIEQSKKLSELGIIAASMFWHTINVDPITPVDIIEKWQHSNFDNCEKYPAYTVAELGVMLPALSHSWVTKGNSYFNCSDNFNVGISNIFSENTEAEARAALLIYLLEEKIITPEEVNQRLNNL